MLLRLHFAIYMTNDFTLGADFFLTQISPFLRRINLFGLGNNAHLNKSYAYMLYMEHFD
jgi:hypothetical protein